MWQSIEANKGEIEKLVREEDRLQKEARSAKGKGKARKEKSAKSA